jgi:hypothetical protein
MEAHEDDFRSEISTLEKAHAVQDDYRSAGLEPAEMALLDYAVKLTTSPRAMTEADVETLRRRGFTDEQILDAVHCIGYFNFITACSMVWAWTRSRSCDIGTREARRAISTFFTFFRARVRGQRQERAADLVDPVTSARLLTAVATAPEQRICPPRAWPAIRAVRFNVAPK